VLGCPNSITAERPFPLHTGVAMVTAIEQITPAMRHFVIHHHWVPRGGLRRSVGELELPGEPGQALGGGEARVMRDVRRHLQAHRPGLAMRLLGYWKR
jgi:NADPH-dependent ferric siderophore reductase